LYRCTFAPTERWSDYEIGVPYPNDRGKTCDWAIGSGPRWQWAIEVKMLRMLGDNNKPDDAMIKKILLALPEAEQRADRL
jgi:hypothetical protein